MKLIPALDEHMEELVRISKAAFDSDALVGAEGIGGPDEYDNLQWHREMMTQGHLFTALENGKIVGGAILFVGREDESRLFIGRIFVDPAEFKKGYGMALMDCAERMYPEVQTVVLDTPVWNTRTNRFYRKLGYVETGRDAESVFYCKNLR